MTAWIHSRHNDITILTHWTNKTIYDQYCFYRLGQNLFYCSEYCYICCIVFFIVGNKWTEGYRRSSTCRYCHLCKLWAIKEPFVYYLKQSLESQRWRRTDNFYWSESYFKSLPIVNFLIYLLIFYQSWSMDWCHLHRLETLKRNSFKTVAKTRESLHKFRNHKEWHCFY